MALHISAVVKLSLTPGGQLDTTNRNLQKRCVFFGRITGTKSEGGLTVGRAEMKMGEIGTRIFGRLLFGF